MIREKASESSLSVCLLTFNRSAWLPATLDSILAQDREDFELVISDNASSDDTEKICRKYEAMDKRIRYFRNSTNLGMTGNYKAALGRSTGDFVAFLHDCDLYRRDLLSKWVSALEKHPTAAFVFNAIESIDEDGQTQTVFRHPYPELVRGRELLTEVLERLDSPVFGMVLVRRTAFQAVGTFNAAYGWHGDVDMWLRLLAEFDVVYINEELIRARRRPTNHPLTKIDWPSIEALYDMYRTNITRCYRDDQPQGRQAIRRLRRRTLIYSLKCLASCLLRRQLDRATRALPLMGRLIWEP